MRKSILAAPFVAATAALALGMGAAAQASVAGSVSDGNGTAGYYTQSFGVQYKQANATFTLNKPALDQLSVDQNGGIGAQLCNATTGYTAQVGVIPSHSDVGTWDVVVAQGFYVGDPTGTGSPCDGNILFFGTLHHTVIGHLPAGEGAGPDPGGVPPRRAWPGLHGRQFGPGELQLLPAVLPWLLQRSRRRCDR